MGVRLLVILAGGTAGTAVRAAIEEAVPAVPGAWPWATFLVNLSGALVLGALLEILVRSGPDEGGRRLIRLGVGTGVLGGYTTYSTFAVEVTERTTAAAPLLGLSYAVATVVLGALAAAAGLRIAATLGHPRDELAPTAAGGDTE